MIVLLASIEAMAPLQHDISQNRYLEIDEFKGEITAQGEISALKSEMIGSVLASAHLRIIITDSTRTGFQWISKC
jgi:hypothetical protein